MECLRCEAQGEPIDDLGFFVCDKHIEQTRQLVDTLRAKEALAELKRRHVGEPGWED